MSKIRVVIFDDNKSRRDSLRMLISLYDDMEFVGAYVDCIHVIQNIESSTPDVVLMDIEMPHMNGIQGVMAIRKKYPLLPVIMQTVSEDDDKIFESIQAGANGYILKKAAPEKIIEAIRDVYEGGAPMTPAIAQRVLHFFQHMKEGIAKNEYDLTAREREILAALVEGMSHKMIAAQKELSYHTVNAHIRNIYDKLHVHSLGEAVSKAIREKLI